MNHLIKLIILGSLIFLFAVAGRGQGLQNNPKLQDRITQAKLKEIQKALQLNEGKMLALAPIYTRYAKEINRVHLTRQGQLLRANPDSLTEEKADQLITSHLNNAVEVSTIRKNFYPEFKAVLTPKQILRLYQSEAQMHRKIMQELRKRRVNRAKKS